MIELLQNTWNEKPCRSHLVGIGLLSLNILLLFFLNLPGASLLTVPSFGMLVITLIVPWGVVLGKIRGITLFLNTLLNLSILFYYALHGSFAVGLGSNLRGFRFTLISIQLYGFIIGMFFLKYGITGKKARELFHILTEDEYVQGFSSKLHRLGIRAFSWVDALLDAAILVVFINIFIFQLYVVPTESMVPTLMVDDRPFVIKITEGPKLPVTNFGIPRFRQPDRGDILVVRNPRYDQSPAAEARKLLSDVVYMLTFTGVLLDKYDENGEIKADPLVKRIIGIPGETLEMVNDVIYRRVPGGRFEPLDRFNPEEFPDLFRLPPDLLPLVREFPLDQSSRAFLTRIDNLADPTANGATFAQRYSQLAQELERLAGLINQSANQVPLDQVQPSILAESRRQILVIRETYPGVSPFQVLDLYGNDQLLALALGADTELLAEAQRFFISTHSYGGDSKFYQQAAILNQLIKLDFARLILSTYQTLGVPGIGPIEERRQIISRLNELFTYLRFYNLRNFPPFPAEDQVIADGQFFFMGDNRLNSLDARHRDYREQVLDKFDSYSIIFATNLQPRSVGLESLVGWTSLRVFPFGRFGLFQ
jgi:signal peptidase I